MTTRTLRKSILLALVAPLWLAPIPIETGGVPVIAASPSPVKVKPTDPGGIAIPYQGIFVMDPSLSAGADQTERLMAAPEEALTVSR